MRTQDYEVLSHAHQWLQQGDKPWLCTIVKAIGSSPRPIGSMLSCLENGLQTGSLSGGCVEDDLLERLHNQQIPNDKPLVVEYGVTPEENERLGLPCGGRLYILVQQLDEGDLPWLDEIINAMNERKCVIRHLDINSGKSTIKPVEHFATLSFDESSLQQCYGPRMRMLLVGAGQLGQSIAELALAMDYEVLVTDTRENMLAQWEGPEVSLIQGMPDDVVLQNAADKFSIVITLTHDPRIDDMALMEALKTDAWYVGSLGSQRTTDKRLERLKTLGLEDEHIAKLHAPVGLKIGSKTPIEIAVAVMAELTQLRRQAQ